MQLGVGPFGRERLRPRGMLPAIRAAATAATAAGPSSYGYDPTINPPPAGAAHVNQTTVTWPPFTGIDTWVEQQDLVSLRSAFERDGYVVVRGLVEACAQPVYLALHDERVSGGLARTPEDARRAVGDGRGGVGVCAGLALGRALAT